MMANIPLPATKELELLWYVLKQTWHLPSVFAVHEMSETTLFTKTVVDVRTVTFARTDTAYLHRLRRASSLTQFVPHVGRDFSASKECLRRYFSTAALKNTRPLPSLLSRISVQG